MENNILISIITASYNYAEYISDTINSVLNQTYKNWELIIVDDGSSDNSIEIIKEFCQKDNRIKLYTHENNQNKGLSQTIKLAVEKSKGEYIAFVESDDYIREDYLEKKVNFLMQNNNYGVICNNIIPFGTTTVNKDINKYIKKMNNFWKNKPLQNEIINNLWFWNVIPTFSCVMVKTELLKQCNFNLSKQACLDWFLWSQICGKTNFYFINENLTFWRLHNLSYTCKDFKAKDYYIKSFYLRKELYKNLPPLTGLKNKIIFNLIKFLRNIKYFLYFREMPQ